jgi:hypothetical protein
LFIGEDISPADILQPNPNSAPFFMSNPTNQELDKMIEDGAYNISESNKKSMKKFIGR